MVGTENPQIPERTRTMPESKPRKKAAAKKTTARRTAQEVRDAVTGGTAKERAEARSTRPTQVTSASEWLTEAEGVLEELPSGKVVRVIMPGMQAFIEADLIPNELMPIVLDAIQKQQSTPTNEFQDMQRDPQMLLKLVETTDRIFAYCVTEPVFLPAVPKDQREPGVLYTDMVSMEDKGYVFQIAVGGPRDLAQFRAEQATQLAALSSR